LVAAAAPLLPDGPVDDRPVVDVAVVTGRADEAFDWTEGWTVVEIVVAGTMVVLVSAPAATAASARKRILIESMAIDSRIESEAEYSEQKTSPRRSGVPIYVVLVVGYAPFD
jgi:hypothetical protein